MTMRLIGSYIVALVLLSGCGNNDTIPTVGTRPVPYPASGKTKHPRIKLGRQATPANLSPRNLMKGVDGNTALIIVRNRTGHTLDGYLQVDIAVLHPPSKYASPWHGKGGLLNGGARIIKAGNSAPGEVRLVWSGADHWAKSWRSVGHLKGDYIKGGVPLVLTIWPGDKVTAVHRRASKSK